MPISTTAACCQSWCATAFPAASWRRAAPSISVPTCCRTPAASRNPRSHALNRRNAARGRRRGQPDLYPGRCDCRAAIVHGRSTMKNGSMSFRAFARATGMPDICSAPPRSRSNSPTKTHRGKPLRILASGDIGPDAKLLQPILRRRRASTTSSRNRPMATASVRRSRRCAPRASCRPKSAMPRRARAPC